MNLIRFSVLILVLGLFAGCDEYVPTPRKHAFPRMDLPTQDERDYLPLNLESCPFNFSYPVGGNIEGKMKDSCVMDINFPAYNLTWHLTYRHIPTSGKPHGVHFEEFRRLIYKHAKKGRIQEANYQTPAGQGRWFEIYGEVGTPAQVFFTDSLQENLLMISMYYQDATTRDSLQPLTNYMKEELDHAFQTLNW